MVERLLLQVDGTPGSPPWGSAGLGIVVRAPDGRLLHTRCARAPAWTCNEAEYQALLAGLRFVLQRYPQTPVHCLTDSRVVVDQVTGKAMVHAAPLKPLYVEARALIARCVDLELIAIPPIHAVQ
jgi:ribonuclease HI